MFRRGLYIYFQDVWNQVIWANQALSVYIVI
jgi:hypothetical protein